ncbi:MAG: FtsQ-type POTRA domain-containing protein [Nitrospina sp.]|jgi:cell division protein FtsQ|nr:FtsQ-type POTRA domain-containing protein [Nitrospina sp.]MBT6716935.1 FtsQ-type POTRA domain-containing protein [Nitrospina sp.]
MSFAVARQKGPAAAWDDLRSERNKKRKRGSALNSKNPSKPKIGSWGRALAELASKLFLAGVVGYLVFAGYNFLITTPRFQIQEVSFRGNQVLSDSEIFDWLGPIKGENLIAIDLVGLSQQLSEHPWVQSASIQRKFPQGLEFELTERVPYARIKKDKIYLMDNFGVILSPERPEYRHLPLIVLQETKEKDLLNGKVLHSLKTMHYFNKLPFFKNNPLDAAELVGHSRVLFITKNRDLQIQMSMDALKEGHKNFMIILDSLEEENLKFQMIDLSFKNQVVVRENFKPSTTLISTKSQTN